MKETQKQLLSLCMGVLLVVSMIFAAKEASTFVSSKPVNTTKEQVKEMPCVVIDAGHGGSDPGKIGINNALEKDLNLQIAERVKKYLEANDIEVVMTREGDDGLYDSDASNKKVQDMKRRIALIDETKQIGRAHV